jgi:MOSC domain-containing protein YiiM
MKKIIEGKIAGVYLVPPENPTLESAAAEELHVTLEGLVGDRHFGYSMHANAGRMPYYPHGAEIRNTRQLTIVSLEELAQVAAEIGLERLQPQWFGANLALVDVPDLTRLPIGTRIFFPDEAVLVSQGKNNPCSQIAERVKHYYPGREDLGSALIRAALYRRGIVAWVERAGTIRAADHVRLELPEIIGE